MKLTLALSVAALLATVSAQGLGDLPNCARDCATSAIPASCGIDVECICTTKSFISDISCCVADKCSKDDQETTLKVAKSICARGGVTDIPTEVVCSTGASTTTGATETGTTTKSNSKDSTVTGTNTNTNTKMTATTTGTKGSETSASKTASESAAATTSGAAVHGQVKDATLMAAAGAVAAAAFFV